MARRRSRHHSGKIVTVIVDHTTITVLDDGTPLLTTARSTTTEVTQHKAKEHIKPRKIV